MEQVKQVEKRSKLKRWYKFNKQKLPMFLTILAALFFTGFLDFTLQNQENIVIFRLLSHFDANYKMGHENGGAAMFMIFALNFLAIIQVFNTVTFASKRSPLNLYLITGLNALQVVCYSNYLIKLFAEQKVSPEVFNIAKLPSAQFSIAVFTIGIIIQLASTILAWMYVDWKYVKLED